MPKKSKLFLCPGCRNDQFVRKEVVEQSTPVTIAGHGMIVTPTGNATCEGQLESKFVCSNCNRMMTWTGVRRRIEKLNEPRRRSK